MKSDIDSRRDIDALMERFYGRAMTDPLIGYLFTDVAHLDLEHHLPVIGDFWESTLLGTPAYRRHGRNPLQIHAALDRREPLTPEHFDRWLVIFAECVDEAFSGARAEFAKLRSRAIAHRMQEYVAATR